MALWLLSIVLLLFVAYTDAFHHSIHLPRTTTTLLKSTISPPTSGRNLELERPDGFETIYYDAYFGNVEEKGREAVVYLPCLSKTKNNAKASNLEGWCKRSSRSFVSADYLGCGRSKGTFIDGNLSRWVDDTIVLLDSLRDVSPTFSSKQKFVLVGGGVGGWVGVVLAIKRPDLVRGIVGLASDPDFTEDLLWQTFSDAEKDEIMTVGYKDIHWGSETYPISKSLIEDGRQNLILRGGDNSLDVHCPVRLIHAITDEEVPYTTALKLAACIKSRDVVCTFPKTGCHQLDDEEDFRRMREAVKDVIESSVEYDLRSPGSG